MEILVIFALILLNGIFSMSEMALVSSRKFKLDLAAKKGKPGAKTAIKLSENPTKFLSTVQIGITLIGVLLGVYSGENLSDDVKIFLNQFDILAPYSNTISTILVVMAVTYLSIVLGELLPKRLGMTFPEPIALLLAKPMKVLSIITSPFVWLLTISNDLLLKMLGIKKTTESRVSEEEIKSIIKESAEGGEIQDIEQDIVERVFELGDRKINSLLTHKNDLVYFSDTDSWETIQLKIAKELHSAYPVCRGNNIDDIVGLIMLKDLFAINNAEGFELQKFLRSPIYVNENALAYTAFDLFKSQKSHYAIVIDEYGSTVGLLTMNDVVHALLGHVSEKDEDDYQIVQRDENSWLVDGQYSFLEFIKYFNIEMPEKYNPQYTTVAGMLIFRNSKLPEVGEKFVIGNYEFEIVDKDGQRIDKIMLTKL
jgi:putative hemolysin